MRTLGVRAGLALVLFTAILLSPGIHVSLFDRDEGWYAQVSREMLETGEYLTPHYLGKPWMVKPPLLYWLVTGSFRVLGVGEWQARLVCVLAGCIVVLLTGMLGARLFDRRTGIVAALLLATSALFTIVGRMLLIDGPMLACTLGAVVLHWSMRERASLPRALAYWALIGVGVLAKGPATLVFAGAFGLALLVSGWRRWIADPRYWAGLPAAVLIAAPWYALMARREGETFLHGFLWYEIFSRISQASNNHGGPPGYYVLVSLSNLLPWTVLAPGAVIEAWRGRRAEPHGRLLLVWLALPWVVLELVRTKLPHYILPCYVPLMILLAVPFARAWDRASVTGPTTAKGAGGVLRLWPLSVVGVGVALMGAGPLMLKGSAGWAAAGAGLVLVAGFALVGARLHALSTRSMFGLAVATTAVFHVVVGGCVLPALESHRLSRRVAETLNALAGPESQVLLCGYDEPSTFFYLRAAGRPVSPHALADTLAGLKTPAVLAITSKAREALPPGVSANLFAAPPERVSGLNYNRMERTMLEIGPVSRNAEFGIRNAE